MSQTEKVFEVRFEITETNLAKLLASLSEAETACEAMADDCADKGIMDAAEEWEGDLQNLQVLRSALERTSGLTVPHRL